MCLKRLNEINSGQRQGDIIISNYFIFALRRSRIASFRYGACLTIEYKISIHGKTNLIFTSSCVGRRVQLKIIWKVKSMSKTEHSPSRRWTCFFRLVFQLNPRRKMLSIEAYLVCCCCINYCDIRDGRTTLIAKYSTFQEQIHFLFRLSQPTTAKNLGITNMFAKVLSCSYGGVQSAIRNSVMA